MTKTSRLDTVERIGYGLALILAPVALTIGFGIHPKDGDTGTAALQIVADQKGRWEFAHILIMLGATLLVFAAIGINRRLAGGESWTGMIGTATTIFGAVFFACLIAAEGIVLSALASVSAEQQSGVAAGVQTILDSKGALPIVNLSFFMLPGLVLLGIGLLRESSTPRWVGLSVIIGTIVLLPVINEQVEAVGALIILVGFGYVGIESIRNANPGHLTDPSEEPRATAARA